MSRKDDTYVTSMSFPADLHLICSDISPRAQDVFVTSGIPHLEMRMREARFARIIRFALRPMRNDISRGREARRREA